MVQIAFDNSYVRLPAQLYSRLAPTPVTDPSLITLNHSLANRLGLDAKAFETPEGIAILAGNAVPSGADPLAQTYGGHQFGNWSGRLGDGRAILLGEVVTPDGARFDIQLKGSGPTPYSRNGDGRAWLGPVLREYLVSEAMHALGVPTTRALAAVSTGERVQREEGYPGAVLTRVASSHIRVGTFQYMAATEDAEGLAALVEHTLARHYPDRQGPLGLLNGVIERQAALIAKWMGLGFVHGVMNTDNMTISGETIDYGPCAFIDTYQPMAVYSSIDHAERYAFARQPDVAMWNLAQLATSLLPMINDQKAAQAALDRFPGLFQSAWTDVFRCKIGLQTAQDGDVALIHDLLTKMAEGQADFTNTFRALGTQTARDQFLDPASFDAWQAIWAARLEAEGATLEDRIDDLRQANPAVIPRTHRIEQAIHAAVADDFAPFNRLLTALLSPYMLPHEQADLAKPPAEDEIVPRTFCGT
ncbi:MAG: YdiU family protein [Silicimonas sp.]|nr:YdiU family protein [Silicimonas sp.]